MRLLRNILAVAALLLSTVMSADEGFWLVQDINPVLENNMRAKGLKLRPKEIYNVDAPGSGLADAVVSLGFKYSGSIVSNWGLVLTCADPAIAFMDRLGDVGQQLLKDGFHAVSEAHEIPVEGEKIYSLKRVFDVTEEVRSMRKGGMDYGEITSRLENAYNESTTLMCRLTSEWAGAKYYIAAYKVYDDVRLVVMPPLSLARMGGEDGKWSWPAHRCDFALFRIYDHGKPVSGAKTLDVSLDGYSEGSFAMTIGFPNFTERFLPSAGMRFREEVALPLTNSLRCGLAPAREASEQWMADSFLANLDRVFKATKRVETDKILRDETLRDGTFAGSYLRRAASAGDLGKMKEILLAGIRETDPATEKELLEYALSEFFTNMDDYYMGDFQRWIQDRFGYDYDAAAEYLWKGSLLSSQSKIQEMEDPSEINGDLLLKFLNDSPLSLYNGRAGHRAALDQIGSLSQEYVRKIYDDGLRRGVPVYPDANSTVRFTYGTIADSYTTPAEYLALLDPKDPERDLGPNLKALMMKDFWGRWGFKVGGKKHRMVIDFISDNDFVDGCQGSPVLDNQGHLIGVVSGGTPETRAGSDFYKEGSSKCVSTDIHFVLWYLGKGIELKRIVKEFEIL